MKLSTQKVFPMVIAIIILLIFGGVLTIYTTPMENISLDLSLMLPDGADPAEYDEKGWTVYTQEGDIVTELISNGMGGYTGLEPGQTFYFSRLMEEALDSPTLQLGIVDRNFAIFLDGELVYTDCPQQNTRIGYLRLPPREWEVDEWLTVTLPEDFQGKVLTIAQSTSAYADNEEFESFRVYPTNVRLYCGYSYESELIAESFSGAILAALVFLVGTILLAAFLRFRSPKSLCMALTAFLWMSSLLSSLSFFHAYFRISYFNVVALCRLSAAFTLLIYLILQSGRKARVMWAWVVLCGLSLGAYVLVSHAAPQSSSDLLTFLKGNLQEWLVTLGLICAVILCAGRRRREDLFCRLFVPLAAASMAVYWGIQLVTKGGHVWQQLTLGIRGGHITYFYYRTIPLIIVSALAAALVQVFQREIRQRTEKQLLEQRREMTLAGYENMRRQHEEVMMLRHDMVRHFRALRSMTDQEQIQSYLDDILGQNKKVRPVVQSGNEMLDIILNSRLGDAMDEGILVEIIRTQVPGSLPLTNADLCSLVMNITDNALAAAAQSGQSHPFIRLDLHVKSGFLVFICENSVGPAHRKKEEKTQTTPQHGLGLKIIHSIAQKYEGLVDTEYDETHYRIRVAVPLF